MGLNPHNWLHRVTPVLPWPLRPHPADAVLWRCHYCHAEGTLDELHATACAYEYPPCQYCGQTPECAADCAGIAAALSGADVYLAGSLDPTRKA